MFAEARVPANGSSPSRPRPSSAVAAPGDTSIGGANQLVDIGAGIGQRPARLKMVRRPAACGTAPLRPRLGGGCEQTGSKPRFRPGGEPAHRWQLKRNVQGFKQVKAAIGMSRAAIAVLGHRNPCRGEHKSGAMVETRKAHRVGATTEVDACCEHGTEAAFARIAWTTAANSLLRSAQVVRERCASASLGAGQE